MKIIFVINSLQTGGAERVVQILSNFFVNTSHEVSIICTDNNKCSYEIDDKVRMQTLKCGVLSRGPGKVLALPLQGFELSRIIKKRQPDVIISFLVRANIVNIISSLFYKRKPVIISERNMTNINYRESSLKNFSMHFLIQKLYPKADIIIANSKDVRQSLMRRGFWDYKIRVINNPISLSLAIADLQRHRQITKTDKIAVVVSCGRLIKQKNFGLLLRAFRRLRDTMPVKLVIIGDGPEKAALEALIKHLDIFDHVKMTGLLQDPKIEMAKADIFVLSSKFEGFGNVILEAMSLGLPVVCTNCPGGPPEILADGRFGKLVPMDDDVSLSAAMRELLTDENQRQHYREMSLKRVHDFDVNTIAPQYLTINHAEL